VRQIRRGGGQGISFQNMPSDLCPPTRPHLLLFYHLSKWQKPAGDQVFNIQTCGVHFLLKHNT
jgi:hypothetical protein